MTRGKAILQRHRSKINVRLFYECLHKEWIKCDIMYGLGWDGRVEKPRATATPYGFSVAEKEETT